MIKVNVYYPSDDAEHRDTLKAFANGCTQFDDISVDWVPLKNYTADDSPDVAVVFGIFKEQVAKSYRRGAIAATQDILKKHTIVLEKGYLKRNEYYSAGWYKHHDANQPNGLNGRAEFCNSGMPPDRWNLLNLSFDNMPTGNGILLCGQVPHDASVQYSDHQVWLVNAVRELKKLTDRKIYFRPHPEARALPRILGTEWSTETIEEDLTRCSTAVTYNSNVGVLAALAGLTVFALDQGSMVWGIAQKDLKKIDQPIARPTVGREQWAHDIAYAQWTHKEMEDGLAWQHLSSKLRQEKAA